MDRYRRNSESVTGLAPLASVTRNKRRLRDVVRSMLINNIKALTPEQVQAHLQVGRLNARGTHRSKKAYSRKDKYGKKDW